jgi:hypothetical protein
LREAKTSELVEERIALVEALGGHGKETGGNPEVRHKNNFLIVVCLLFVCVYLLEALVPPYKLASGLGISAGTTAILFHLYRKSPRCMARSDDS